MYNIVCPLWMCLLMCKVQVVCSHPSLQLLAHDVLGTSPSVLIFPGTTNKAVGCVYSPLSAPASCTCSALGTRLCAAAAAADSDAGRNHGYRSWQHLAASQHVGNACSCVDVEVWSQQGGYRGGRVCGWGKCTWCIYDIHVTTCDHMLECLRFVLK